MSYYLEVPLGDGKSILAEVTTQIDGELPAGSAATVVGKLPGAFHAGLDRAQTLAGDVLARMRGLAEPPDVVSVEFGLSLSATTGVVVAESAATGHIKIAVEWHRNQTGASDQ